MENIVDDLVKKSLRELKKIACENESIKTSGKSKSKLIFPKYCVGKHEGTKRISEQEARFLFVRELERQNDFYYSIETPTKQSYKFSDKTDKKYQPQIVEVKNGGQSASVDVTLFVKDDEKFCRKHLIEFKHGNVDTCKKDFLKLIFDMDGLYNYYINILDRDDFSKRKTFESVITKYQNAINELKKEVDSKNNSVLKIILFNINDCLVSEWDSVKSVS